MIARLAVLCAAVALGQADAGELSRRFERTLDRVLEGGPPRYTAELLLADLTPDSSRRFAEFSGDLSGRFLGAMALAGPRGQAAAAALGPEVFALQRPDGGFRQALSPDGATEADMAQLWGHGRLLVGLLEYHQATGDPESLQVARRLGDFLVDLAARFNAAKVREAFHQGAMAHGYICWTQNVEGLALLARASGEERYRDAARSIADGIERRPGQHAHGWLSSLRGLALLAEDDATLRPDLERAWASFAESQDLLWTGGPPEYFAPGIARDEGCAAADWVRLNLSLWRMSANERYLLAAEDALFNAFFANQRPDGGFGHLRLSPRGFDYGGVEAWWCCTLHGARAFPAIANAAFRAEDDALAYDLPVDGRGEAQGLVVEADAEPARDGRVRFRIVAAPPGPATLRIRKPSRTAELRSPFGATQGPWLAFERQWRTGESFEVEYVFSTEASDGGGVTLVHRGPWTLGASEGADPALFNESTAKRRFDWQALAAADRPSRATLGFEADSFGGQTARTTLRPIAERWESGEHGLRWTTRFGAPEQAEPQPKAVRYAKPAAAGFAAGMLLMGLWMWLRRGRKAAR